MGNSSVTQVLVGTGTNCNPNCWWTKITGGTPCRKGSYFWCQWSGKHQHLALGQPVAPIYILPIQEMFGIGVTSLGYKLDVAGTINATNLYVAGQPYKLQAMDYFNQWFTSVQVMLVLVPITSRIQTGGLPENCSRRNRGKPKPSGQILCFDVATSQWAWKRLMRISRA